MWFGLLGAFSVLSDAGKELEVGPPQRRELLAVLLSQPNQPVSVDSIVDALWPSEPPAGAKGSIQSHISRLRGSLGPDRIVTRASGYLVRVAPDTFDVLDFFQSVRDGQKLAEQGSRRAAFEELSRGLSLWRGKPLWDFAYCEWAQMEISHLNTVHRAAVRERFNLALALGLHNDVLPELEIASNASPDDEDLVRLLATAFYRAGRQQEALDRLETLRKYLAEEMGLDPSPQTEELQLAILQHDVSLLPLTVAAQSVSPRSPGIPHGGVERHRPWEGNIREPLSEFVGREFSIAELTTATEKNRLVTITGPGGSGKTRLAIRVALGVESRFKDGAWLIDLDEAADSEGIVPSIRRSLGLVEDPEDNSTGSLTETIDGRQALLVLDNCEHVVEKAAEICEGVLQACPNVRIIATSREPLAISGEQLWRIPTLETPPQDEETIGKLLTYESVALFVLRAKRSDQSFRVGASNVREIAQICRALDGLPLAIEMAAAQLTYRSLSELATGIVNIMGTLSSPERHAPSRHRTLTTAIDWSIDSLSDSERNMLTRLSVYETTFDRGAAVALGPPDPQSAERTLHRLVDQSLVTKTSGARSRYRLLVPVRNQLRGNLESGEMEVVQADVANHVAGKASQAGEGLTGHGAMSWYWWSVDNRQIIEDSLRWCVTRAPDLGAGIVSGLYLYLPNAAPWLGYSIDTANRTSDSRLRSSAHAAAAMLAIQTRDNELARFHAHKALDIADTPRDARFSARNAIAWSRLLTRHLDPDLDGHLEWIQELSQLSSTPFQEAWVNHLQGLAHLIVGEDPVRAITFLDASVETAKEHDFQWLLGFMMNNHAEALYLAQKIDYAMTELEEAIVTCSDLELWPDLVAVLVSRAYWQIQTADTPKALASAVEAVTVAFRHGVESQLAIALEVLAMALVKSDKHLAGLVHAGAHWIRDRNRTDFDSQLWDSHNQIEATLGRTDAERYRLESPDGISGLLTRLKTQLPAIHP